MQSTGRGPDARMPDEAAAASLHEELHCRGAAARLLWEVFFLSRAVCVPATKRLLGVGTLDPEASISEYGDLGPQPGKQKRTKACVSCNSLDSALDRQKKLRVFFQTNNKKQSKENKEAKLCHTA